MLLAITWFCNCRCGLFWCMPDAHTHTAHILYGTVTTVSDWTLRSEFFGMELNSMMPLTV